MRIIKLTDESKCNILENLLKRSPNSYGEYESAVAEILADVKSRGDEALFEYTRNFDKADINAGNIAVTQAEIDEAYSLVDPELLAVIRKGYRACKSRSICSRRKSRIPFVGAYECYSCEGC